MQDPIELGIIQGGSGSCKVRRLGLHVLGELRPGNSRATMTGDAAFFLEVKAASVDHLGIVKRSGQADIVAGVAFNRIDPDCLKRPADDVRVLLAGGDIVESEIGVACQSDDDCNQDNSDRSQGSHGLLPWRQALSRMPTVCQSERLEPPNYSAAYHREITSRVAETNAVAVRLACQSEYQIGIPIGYAPAGGQIGRGSAAWPGRTP
ncbi:hypothetical protein MPLB_390013 [Mesorhizobium sp. ORS 3324]|nr:hypothetical protein MPLB_390013 [Mesorhizobium sp. ORS 3324]